jgi:probable F420-dependent oxidoreductase
VTSEHTARPDGFRFAVQLANLDTLDAWRNDVRWAEDAGFDVISVPDHVGGQLAPLPTLAAAAMITSRVRLGTFVLANGFRNVALLANDVATIDVLSGGRVELGLGCGWDEAEHRQLGVPFPAAPTRMEELAATVQFLRRAWRGEEITDGVGPLALQQFQSFPPPVSHGGPPLVIGAGGPRMLRLAAQIGDIVAIVPPTEGLKNSRTFGRSLCREAALRQAAIARANSSRPALNLRILRVAVEPDGGDVASLASVEGMTADELAASPFAAIGSVSAICDHLRGVREELGISYFTVSQRHAQALAPVIQRLTGS